MKRKITITTGTRADYGILKPILEKIQKNENLEMTLIATGMHFSKKHGESIKEIKKDKFKFLEISRIKKNDSLYEMSIDVGQQIIKFTKIFHKIKPDINIIFGDRDEMLASAIASYHLNILNAHIHGGDRSMGGIDEYNRHAITKISNIHFPATKQSFNRIIKMGENPKYIFQTGSPSIDLIKEGKITSKQKLESKYKIKFLGKEILLLQHPITTQTTLVEKQIKNTINALGKFKETIIAIGPNSDSGNNIIFNILEKTAKKNPYFKIFPNIPREDYLGMLKNCKVLIGNSSSGIIEASHFPIKVINIGIRQKGRECNSNVIHVEHSTKKIEIAIKNALKTKKMKIDKIYGNGNASKRIVHHLEKIPLDDQIIQKQIFY
jgi:GDP/UDP-N,N'-diacetylbacillosamine 2-epimerase (hydrolysing)